MNFAKRVPGLIVLILFIVIFVLNLRPSEQLSNIFIWSWWRFAFIVVIFLLILYFFVSLFKNRLISINNYLIYLVVVVLAVIELTIHLQPKLVPQSMWSQLPQDVRQNLAQDKGFMTDNQLIGSGMLYHFRPNQDLPNGIHIDSLGYRNSVDMKDQVDVVLLGDSIIFADGIQKDLGELFREKEYNVINLAIPGFAPQHYLEAYKENIVQKQIPHQVVITFLYIGNDIKNADYYHQIEVQNKDYRAFLGEKVTEENHLPWIVNILKTLPFYILNNHIKNRNETINIELPYKTITTKRKRVWWTPEVKPDDPGWQYTKQTIDQINSLAKENNAIPIVFLIPDPSRIYSQFSDYFAQYDQGYIDLVKLLSDHFNSTQVTFIDLADPLREIIKTHFIFRSDADNHFGDLGTQKMFEVILPYVENSILPASKF